MIDLRSYRAIDGLLCIGPEEWERAFISPNSDNPNPLGLTPGWCPKDIPIPYTLQQMQVLAELCATPEWNTRPVLWLALPEVNGIPTSLINQYDWWGFPSEDSKPGKIRSDILRSSWFKRLNYSWVTQPVVVTPTWMIGYEFPNWTACHSWNEQKQAAKQRKMSFASATQEVLMSSLAAISTNMQFRLSFFCRTSTFYDETFTTLERPVAVGWDLNSPGLGMSDHWNYASKCDTIGAAIQGVPPQIFEMAESILWFRV